MAKKRKHKKPATTCHYYTTLQDEKLDLKKLNKRQRQLLRKFYELYQENCDYVDFVTRAGSNDSQKAIDASVCDNCGNGDHYWIDQKASKEIIYRLLNDLADRLAIKQGFLRKGRNSNTDFNENEKVLKKFLRLGSG